MTNKPAAKGVSVAPMKVIASETEGKSTGSVKICSVLNTESKVRFEDWRLE